MSSQASGQNCFILQKTLKCYDSTATGTWFSDEVEATFDGDVVLTSL
ncbi:MAG: hypothetical protein ABJQ38_01005 [Flavobacteriaceae bacterium]